jgi:lipoprotein-anchoring transpeptidase ErfK/SrfK
MIVVAAGCTPGSRGGPGATPDKRSLARLSITPADGTGKVAPDAGISVKVTGGKITRVSVADAEGRKAAGRLAPDGTWHTRWTLRPGTKYTVSAAAVDKDGRQATGTATFTTLTLTRATRLESGMSPLNGETVGVGMPVQLLLSRPVVTRQARTAIEGALEVRMSRPVEGAWSWVSDREVQFRPRTYWPVGEHVTVVAHLAGVRAGARVWGTRDRTLAFRIGPRHITTVNAATHHAAVTSGGRVVRTIPVSLGKPGDDSYSGIMIAQEKAADIIMDSATTGHPGEYRIPTKWNVRMTYSGTFFHAAPWSTGAQGNRNVSHGCVNASPADAKWFFDFTNRGDVIQVTGTSRRLRFGNGPTPWAKSWSAWLAGSALGRPNNPLAQATPGPS